MIVLSVLLLLFVLLALGVPVGFAMGICGFVGLLAFDGWGAMAGVLQSTPLTLVSHYELLTIPMFLLMAEFVLRSGVADDLVDAAAAWIGHVRGGLGIATALAGAGFGAICGTSTASAATLSSTSLPAMLRNGYHPEVAGGVVAISGTLAMLVPPSVALIIYGLLTEVNIAKLLIAGVLPAVLITFTIAATVYYIALRHPEMAPPTERASMRVRLMHLKVLWPVLILFMAVTGVIYTGIATPTEASALGALGAMIIAIWRRRLPPKVMMAALVRTANSTAMLITIVLGAFIFGYFIAVTGVTQQMMQSMAELPFHPMVIIIIILFGYLILGAFMDQLAILVLTAPIVVPVVVNLGYDPIWFGVVMVVMAEVGMVTPPLGMNCFIVSRYSGRPIEEIFKGSFPHVIAHLIAIAILVAFPIITLWLPGQM